MKREFDPSLYAIVDVPAGGAPPRLEMVEAALDGGVTMLQLRAKNVPPRIQWLLARDLLRLTRPRRVPLLINDRADLAVAAGADGAHLGQDDLPVALARRTWPGLLIGTSVHNATEVLGAGRAGADYAASGCLFPTGTKADAAPLDHEVFRDLCRRAELPLLGIGGITVERSAMVMACGAAGVVVSSGLWSAPDVAARARDYRAALDRARARAAAGEGPISGS